MRADLAAQVGELETAQELVDLAVHIRRALHRLEPQRVDVAVECCAESWAGRRSWPVPGRPHVGAGDDPVPVRGVAVPGIGLTSWGVKSTCERNLLTERIPAGPLAGPPRTGERPVGRIAAPVECLAVV